MAGHGRQAEEAAAGDAVGEGRISCGLLHRPGTDSQKLFFLRNLRLGLVSKSSKSSRYINCRKSSKTVASAVVAVATVAASATVTGATIAATTTAATTTAATTTAATTTAATTTAATTTAATTTAATST
jgi:hypothetical protein